MATNRSRCPIPELEREGRHRLPLVRSDMDAQAPTVWSTVRLAYLDARLASVDAARSAMLVDDLSRRCFGVNFAEFFC